MFEKTTNPSSAKDSSSPPRDGCLFCKKDPTASVQQKEEVLRSARSGKKPAQERAKVLKSFVTGKPGRVAVINGLIEVPFCPDTESDSNIVSRQVVNELIDLP